MADYRKALRLFPNSAPVHDSLAWFLATCPESKWRDGKQAVQEATQACNATGWNDRGYIDTLAAALAEAGDFDQAIKREEQAIKGATADDRKSFERRLASYRQRKPWRESFAKP